MKRYLAFKGDIYYPLWAMEDFIGDFDTIEESLKAIDKALLADTTVFELEEYTEKELIESEWNGGLIWAVVYDTEERKNVFSKSTND